MKIGKPSLAICLVLCCCLLLNFPAYGQEGFALPASQKKDRIQFQFLNNLVIIPVEVNGSKLSFLLDTGVNNTLLFSLHEQDSLEINDVTPVKIRGLGGEENIDALKSVHNRLKIGDAIDSDHTLHVIFDDRINFSPRMGIPVHGVIGYDFFKNFVVKTDYVSEQLTVYNADLYKRKSCRNCVSFDLRMIGRKPYIQNKIRIGSVTKDAVLLVDTGASDALWLFDEEIGITENPKNYFEDFLGLGLSGAVYGKRSKLENVHLGAFTLSNVNVSYPDSLARKTMRTFKERDGTLGSEILKRFTVIIDYPANELHLKRNKFFDNPFHYNMAGLVIEHDGMVAASEKQSGNAKALNMDDANTSGAVSFNLQPIFSFFLAPKYVVAEVRIGSPAYEQGIKKGDEVISINGKAAYKYELSSISALFSSRSGRKITVVIDRNGTIFKKKFTLKEVI